MGSDFWGWLTTFVFGVAFNWHIGRLGARRAAQGLNSIFVVSGVGITLLIAASVPDNTNHKLLFTWQSTPVVLSNHAHAVIYLLPFFAAAGLPMVLGSLWRHLRTLDAETPE